MEDHRGVQSEAREPYWLRDLHLLVDRGVHVWFALVRSSKWCESVVFFKNKKT